MSFCCVGLPSRPRWIGPYVEDLVRLRSVVHSLAHYGPRRFYILNTGISTLRPLAQAASELAKDGIVLHYTDLTKDDPVEKKVRQSGGTHADEIETSMMLYIAPLLFTLLFESTIIVPDLVNVVRTGLASSLFGSFAALLVVGYQISQARTLPR